MNDLIKKFRELLDDTNKNENDIQNFLEEHTELIYTPFLLNHGLHFNMVISKMRISDQNICDYAFLTKSTTNWNLVLVEIEDSNKRIFKNNKGKPQFQASFNNAFDQIASWKADVKANKEKILDKIIPLKKPIVHSPVEIKFVLIIGRHSEFVKDHRKSNLFATKSTEDTLVLTYDSLISAYKNHQTKAKMILSHNLDGYKIKSVPNDDDFDTNIFAYISHDYLYISDEIKGKLRNMGYYIDEWEKGKLLTFNHKLTQEHFFDSFKKND